MVWECVLYITAKESDRIKQEAIKIKLMGLETDEFIMVSEKGINLSHPARTSSPINPVNQPATAPGGCVWGRGRGWGWFLTVLISICGELTSSRDHHKASKPSALQCLQDLLLA